MKVEICVKRRAGPLAGTASPKTLPVKSDRQNTHLSHFDGFRFSLFSMSLVLVLRFCFFQAVQRYENRCTRQRDRGRNHDLLRMGDPVSDLVTVSPSVVACHQWLVQWLMTGAGIG